MITFILFALLVAASATASDDSSASPATSEITQVEREQSGKDDKSDDEDIFFDAEQDFDEPIDDSSFCEDLRDELSTDHDSGRSGEGELLRRVKEGLWQRARRTVNHFVEPPKNYFRLIKRYRRWQNEYNNILKQHRSLVTPLASSVSLARAQYAKADHDIVQSIVLRKGITRLGYDLMDLENLDLIYTILLLTIQRLEALLDQYRIDGTRQAAVEAMGAENNDHRDQEGDVREKYEIACDRFKRASKKATSTLQGELDFMAKLLIFNQLATLVADHPEIHPKSGPGAFLVSLMLELGAAHTPLLVTYMFSFKFRAAWMILDYPVVRRALCGCFLTKMAMERMSERLLH